MLLKRSKPLRVAMSLRARGIRKEQKQEFKEYKSALRTLKSGASTREEMDAAHARLERAARAVLARVDDTSTAGRQKPVLKDLHQRYAARLRFGGAGGGTSDQLNATPGVIGAVDYRLSPHLLADFRYVYERYEVSGSGDYEASHWGVGLTAMY